MQISERARRLIKAGIFVTIAGIALIALYRLFGFGIPCPFHAVTGLYCPGCGAMRAVVALSQLQFYQALRYNALLVAALPVLAVLGVQEIIAYLRGKPTKQGRGTIVLIIIFAVLTVAFTILRNLPQFAFLAPTLIG